MRTHGFLHAAAVDPCEDGLPRPSRAVLPYAAIAAAVPVFVAGGALEPHSGAAAGGAAVAAAGAAWAWSTVRRLDLRDRADRFIAAGEGTPPSPAIIAERRAELIGGKERRTLATTLRHVVAAAEGPPLRSARVPIDRAAVRAERARIERLAAALAATEVPVPARSVARTSLLVTDATSPLYRRGGDELHRYLIQTLSEFEIDERR
jgi:hypothetical protein